MVLAPLAVLMQAPLTPEALVDDLTARYGYGAVGTSVSARKPVVVPDLGNVTDVEVRLKNLWRIERDQAMPGVFRPQIAPYSEVFEEAGGVVPDGYRPYDPVRHKGMDQQQIDALSPDEDPAATVSLASLRAPGGARVTARRLAELLDAPEKMLPIVYRRRSALVRLGPTDRADFRGKRAVPLLAALVGGAVNKGGEVVTFEPKRFRLLAMATLRQEARHPVRLIAPGSSAWIYEPERPMALLLGAQAHRALSDQRLTVLYRKSPSGASLEAPDLERWVPGALEARIRALLSRRGKGARTPEMLRAEIGENPSPVLVVFNPSGLGDVSFRSVQKPSILVR